MILGVGNDLCNIQRIQAMLDRFGDRMLKHIFHKEEHDAVMAKPAGTRAAIVAKRFAAKEACAKALGTGIADGVYLRDMYVAHMANGQPVMLLYGGAAQRLQMLAPPGMSPRIHVSLSDEFPLAMATVIISAVDTGGGMLA